MLTVHQIPELFVRQKEDGIFIGNALAVSFWSWVNTGVLLAAVGVLMGIYLDSDCRFLVQLCPGLYLGLGFAAVGALIFLYGVKKEKSG